jgi:ArsR family transcriptional regulator
MEASKAQAKLFKTLAHPTRLAILEILQGGEQCVCHMEAVLGLRQAAISQQLMILRVAGLVTDRRDGWNIFYRVAQPGIYTVINAAAQMTAPDRTESKINSMPCECPKCKQEAKAFSAQKSLLSVEF